MTHAQEPVRLAVIGAGAICRTRHLPNLADIDQANVVVVCNRSEASSKQVAQAFDIPEVADDWRQVIQRDDIDAVLIGTWPYTHKEMSIAALEAGKHVFCQARMAMDLTEARQMLDAARRFPHLVNMICPPPHRMPLEPYLQQLLADDTLGELTGVTLQSISNLNLAGDTIIWREDIALSGKQILALGICAETLNALFGPCTHLSAEFGTFIHTKHDQHGKEVEIQIPQVVSVQGRLENGAILNEYHTGLACDAATSGDWLTIFGLKGTLRLKLMSDDLQLALPGKGFEPVTVPKQQQRPWRVERDFIDAVLKAMRGQPWQVSPDFVEGVAYMQKVEAVHVAATTGRRVMLSEL